MGTYFLILNTNIFARLSFVSNSCTTILANLVLKILSFQTHYKNTSNEIIGYKKTFFYHNLYRSYLSQCMQIHLKPDSSKTITLYIVIYWPVLCGKEVQVSGLEIIWEMTSKSSCTDWRNLGVIWKQLKARRWNLVSISEYGSTSRVKPEEFRSRCQAELSTNEILTNNVKSVLFFKLVIRFPAGKLGGHQISPERNKT